MRNNKKVIIRENNQGITLVALVITVIIIIILASVTVSFVFGDNGLIVQAQKGKEETQIAYTKEELQSVLADAFIEKKINKEYNQDEFLDDFVYDRKPEAELTEEEISLNGYTFELDRSVPELGEYVGESGNLPARIRKIEITNITETEISVEVITARAEGATYKYYLDDEEEPRETSSLNTYTYEDLKPVTEYTIRVVLVNKEGKETEKSIITTTSQATVEYVLKEGDYVYYEDGIGETRQCAVLYGPENANYSNYGIQIITNDTVEDITISDKESLDNTIARYNDCINILNNETNKYLNTKYAISSRCVGSIPNNPSYDASGMYYHSDKSWFSKYKDRIKDLDENYTIDAKQLGKLGIAWSDKSYWYASRNVRVGGETIEIWVRFFGGGSCLGFIYDEGYHIYNESSGLRPVFTLKPGLKVTGGDGTEENPYTLGV